MLVIVAVMLLRIVREHVVVVLKMMSAEYVMVMGLMILDVAVLNLVHQVVIILAVPLRIRCMWCMRW